MISKISRRKKSRQEQRSFRLFIMLVFFFPPPVSKFSQKKNSSKTTQNMKSITHNHQNLFTAYPVFSSSSINAFSPPLRLRNWSLSIQSTFTPSDPSAQNTPPYPKSTEKLDNAKPNAASNLPEQLPFILEQSSWSHHHLFSQACSSSKCSLTTCQKQNFTSTSSPKGQR